MSDMRPSAQTTLGILLGASKWPNAKLPGSPAFANSAQKVKEYFLSSGRFGIRSENWLDLFDRKQSSPYEVDQAISTFLQERTSSMKEAGTPASDLLFYYIGHGILVFGPHQAFHLAILSTDDERVRSSAISMAALADTLKAKARHLRRFVILDCCFAAESSRYMMQSEIGQAALKQTISDFEEKSTGSGLPTRGTALLCSSGYRDASLLLPDESGTMFSEALIRALALRNTHQSGKTHFSLHDLKSAIEQVLENESPGIAPRPEVHSPDQSEGDVASIPFFPYPQIEKSNTGKVDKFTEQTRKALSFAQDEAQRFQHNSIGTEHLLLGLLRVDESVAVKVLSNHGVGLNKVRSAVEFIRGRGDRIILGEISLTPRAKRVIELAVDESRRLNHHYIGTEHLLIALVREGGGTAAGVLESLDVNLEEVRDQTIQILRPPRSPDWYKKEYSRTPITNQLGEDLTAEARAGKFDPVIGRRKEIDLIMQILNRFKKNSLMLLGEPDVGMTAIVEELARRMVNGKVPESIMHRRLLRLNVGSLLASAKSPREREDVLRKSLEEIRHFRCILFIDNIPELLGTDAISSRGNIAQFFKLFFSDGSIQCLCTSTPEAYAALLKQDRSLQTWFEEVIVPEPTIEETLKILYNIREDYEDHHRVPITDEALKAAAEMASHYIPGRFMPDKAINLIDDAASRTQMCRSLMPPDLEEAMKDIRLIAREKKQAIERDEYELAFELGSRVRELRDKIFKLEEDWLRGSTDKPSVGEEEIAQIIAMWTGIPVMQIVEGQMEEALHARVVGQNEAIEKIARTVRRARAGQKDSTRPIGSFIFMGPTGVGKTELAKTLAEVMFGSEEALIKIEMGECMERHAVNLLVGTPAGYVGHEEGGQLTEAIRRKSYGVILLEEIEKAHPQVFNMLLQILEDGKLTDAKGHTVDFRNTVVIMTSNVGVQLLNKEASIGFKQSKDKAIANLTNYDAMKDRILGELKNIFKPEFLNRIDEVIVFHPLRMEEMYTIVELLLKRVRAQLTEQQVDLIVSQVAKDFLIEKGFDAQYGMHVIQRLVENPLEEGLLQGTFRPGELIEAMVLDNELALQVRNRIEYLPRF